MEESHCDEAESWRIGDGYSVVSYPNVLYSYPILFLLIILFISSDVNNEEVSVWFSDDDMIIREHWYIIILLLFLLHIPISLMMEVMLFLCLLAIPYSAISIFY